MPLTIGIVAGEASGDTLGAGLMQSLQQLLPGQLRFIGIAGPKMKAEGCELIASSESIEALGLFEVLKKLPSILSVRRKLKKALLKEKIDCFIGIDAPDFNLPVARFFKAKGIKTVHYVSPSVWAWRKGRIHGIKKSIDLMLTLFPFELEIYQEHQIPAVFVGHPLAESYPLEPSARIESDLAILPGSRRKEVESLLPTFLKSAVQLMDEGVIQTAHVALAKKQHASMLKALLEEHAEGHLKAFAFSVGQAPNVMQTSRAVLLSSGTATLEAMLAKRPMVVCYRLSTLTFAILKRLVNINHIALPNILADAALVPELVQDDVNPRLINDHLRQALSSQAVESIQAQFTEIHRSIQRDANQKAADAVYKLLTPREP